MTIRHDAPVIVIGMHRSGTTMLTQMLEGLGLFVGQTTDDYDEARFFAALNCWLFRQAGATWQAPEPIYHLLDHAPARALAVRHLQQALHAPRVAAYLGWPAYLRYRTPARLDRPWGWKDPRTTYTLPLWLEVFSNAKVIHIYRHGVDVAHSVTVRAQTGQDDGEIWHRRRKLLYWLWAARSDVNRAVCCLPLERSFALWEAYVRQAHQHVRALGPQRALQLQYEHVLEDPHTAARALASFCGLSASPATMDQVARQVQPERAYRYQSHPELARFAVRHAARLAVWGYGAAGRGLPEAARIAADEAPGVQADDEGTSVTSTVR